MRGGFTQMHRKNKSFVLDIGIDDKKLSVDDVEKFLSESHPVFDAGAHGKRIGEMTVSQFLEKFG